MAVTLLLVSTISITTCAWYFIRLLSDGSCFRGGFLKFVTASIKLILNRMNRIIYSFIFLFTCFMADAETQAGPVMADGFRAEGKIWVVISVIALVFLALVGWLIMLEKRIGKIEHSIKISSGKL